MCNTAVEVSGSGSASGVSMMARWMALLRILALVWLLSLDMASSSVSDVPQIVTTLGAKIAEVERWIADTEAKLYNARQDLAHLQATLQLFRRGEDMPHPVYMGLSRIFRRGEITSLGLEALRSAPDGLDTRELATAIMRAKGLDVDERVFRISLTQSVVTLFGRLERKRVVACVERQRGVNVWRVV